MKTTKPFIFSSSVNIGVGVCGVFIYCCLHFNSSRGLLLFSILCFSSSWWFLFIVFTVYFRQWPGRAGFSPRSRQTKDLKNGT